jgi:hypothetical protein
MIGTGNQQQVSTSADAVVKILLWVWSIFWAVLSVVVGVSPSGASQNFSEWLRFVALGRLADYFATNPNITVPVPEVPGIDYAVKPGPIELPIILLISFAVLMLGVVAIRKWQTSRLASQPWALAAKEQEIKNARIALELWEAEKRDAFYREKANRNPENTGREHQPRLRSWAGKSGGNHMPAQNFDVGRGLKPSSSP